MQNRVRLAVPDAMPLSLTMLNVHLLEQMLVRRWMGSGLRCKNRPFDMVEKAFMECLCELPGEECPKTDPYHWGTERTELPRVLEQLNEGFGTTREEQGKEGMV